MYLCIENYSERGPCGHQLIFRQSSSWCEHFEDFYIPTIMKRGLMRTQEVYRPILIAEAVRDCCGLITSR